MVHKHIITSVRGNRESLCLPPIFAAALRCNTNRTMICNSDELFNARHKDTKSLNDDKKKKTT